MIKLIDILNGTMTNPLTGEVYEGLITTVDIDKAINVLSKAKGVNNVWKTGEDMISVSLTVQYPDSHLLNYVSGNIHDTNISSLMKTINNLGYLISGIEYDTGEAYEYEKYSARTFKRIIQDEQPDYIVLQLVKKYDKDVTDSLRDFVYHVTTERALKSIKKIGLKPSSKSKLATHPDRVYVAVDEEAAKHFAKRIKDEESLYMLTIDTSKLIKGTKFYSDPHYTDKAFYTYNNIPLTSIINIKEI